MKMKNTFLLTVTLLFTQIAIAQQKSIDVTASTIKWTGKDITTKTHYGLLKFKEGSIEMNEGTVSGGRFVVDMNSLENQDLSGDSKNYLENHLRSDDFFGIDQHPTASLDIASAKLEEGGQQNIEGYLTIKGITHPINFDMVINEEGATANLIFDRSKYDVKFRSSTFFDDLGDKLIYDEIELSVNLKF